MMLQKPHPEDYIIATGQSHSLEEFVSACFAHFELDWRKYVDIDPELFRKTDIKASYANPEKAIRELGWKAKTQFQELIEILLREEKSGPHFVGMRPYGNTPAYLRVQWQINDIRWFNISDDGRT